MTQRFRHDAVDAMDMRVEFNIGRLRYEHDLTRHELAGLTGIPMRTIERLEKSADTRRATIGEVVVLAKAFGVQPADLLRK